MRPKLATTDCAAENCVRPTEWVDDTGPEHIFAGYGWFARYHKECCPRSKDGTDCEEDH